MKNIQTLEGSWETHKEDYLESAPEDEAREKHLKDWVGDNSLELWQHVAKELGVDFGIAEIEEALIEAGGDIEQAIETLQAEAEEVDYWALAWQATFSVEERNPSLIGVN